MPIDESKFGKGAKPDIIYNWDEKWSDVAIARSSLPFDWNSGYDIEVQLSNKLGISNFKLPVKNQDGSGSCGGQAWSQYSGVLEAFFDKSFEERSAKYIYSQTFVPGGGSAGRANSDVCINQGVARETLCTSYNSGQPPVEAFMERPQDITVAAKQDASTAKELSAAVVNIESIDSAAQAIRDNYGIILGVKGEDNGTWLSAFPQLPSGILTPWYHWIYAGKTKLIDGKKFVGFINSWGNTIGENGWQWLGEEYFTVGNIFNIWTMIFDSNETPVFIHNFSKNIIYGERSLEVQALQQALTIDGEFHFNVTGFYGEITRVAVLDFQKKYRVAPSAELAAVNGKTVGPKTRTKLNELFNK